MIEKFIKEIEEIENSYPSQYTIVEEHIDNFKKSFVGTYDELQERIKEVQKEAKQIYRKKRDEHSKLIKQKEAEMLDYIFDNSIVKDLPNGRKIFDILWANAYRDEHSYGYEAVIADFDEKEADFLKLYKLTQEK